MKNKVRTWFLLLALVSAYFLVIVTYRFSREEWMVDRCLSGYHGSFNYSNMTCDLERTHPFYLFSGATSERDMGRRTGNGFYPVASVGLQFHKNQK